MDQKPITSPPRSRRNPPPPDTRDSVRQDWCSGCSARELERHHGVSRDAINRVRKAEGWTRLPSPPMSPEPPQRLAKVATLDELLDSVVRKILSAYNDKDEDAARELAKSAEIYARLKTRLMAKSAASRPSNDDDLPTFKPERDVFELLAELGITPEDD